ncbi:tyrosine-type recombinase/integrase [Brevibacillus sp. NRS-1366]|uniref:tyrosine-type recombinase/integrase n=1 Tax=Brevibacillus sp. NRS-1366 TaxID=3233899 RepID=UPI003D1F9496
MANIQKRGDNSWFFTVYLGKGADGKYIRKTKTITVDDGALLKTKKKLQDYLDSEYAKFRQEVEAGEYIAPEKMTLVSFVDEWREKYAVKHLETKTANQYMSCLKNRILPALGHLRLDQVKPLHVMDFLESLSKDNSRQDGKKGSLSSSSIQYHHRVLKNIFNRAVEWKVIKSNPVASVQKPKVVYKENLPYDESEVQTLLVALQRELFHWRMMITLALTTGLRLGELLGLEWKHVDLNNGVIEVLQSVASSTRGDIVLKEPKTKNSKRKVSLPASVLTELQRYSLHCRKERLKIGDAWQGGEHSFVFSQANGTPFYPRSPYHWFRKFTKKHGLRHIRFHDLRHTSATLLISQGVHAKIISERLGHATISTTMNIYGHALRSADQAAADTFENILSVTAKG